MIEVRNLTKRFGSHVAVDDVTFDAAPGEILGFLGPNGAGKTTTMRMLTCYLPPTAGTARVAGADILDDSMAVRRHIGYLPESVPLYRDLTVADYLDFVGRLKGMKSDRRRTRIPVVMEETGIADVRKREIGKLSRGYRQRVGIAQALVSDPEVLILDEPTVGLDPRQIVEIRDLIKNLGGQRTVILSTHILPEVSLLCQRIIIINKGRLVAVDTPENLKKRLRGAMVVHATVRGDMALLRASLDAIDGLEQIRVDNSSDGVHELTISARDGVDVREVVASTVVNNGGGLLALGTADMSLEDIFVQLVTQEDGS